MANDRTVPTGPFGMTPQEAADNLREAHAELLSLRAEVRELRGALIACATMLFEHGGHRVDPFVARFYEEAGVPVGERDVEGLGAAWLRKVKG